MTSNFDSLMYLYEIAEKNEEIVPILTVVYEEAVKQLDTRAPKVYNWKRWMGPRKWPENTPLLAQQQDFIDTAHSVLDHGEYHLKCFEGGFARIIHDVMGTIEYKYHKGRERPVLWLRYFQAKDFRRYRKIWEEVVKLIDQKIIGVNIRDVRWKRLKSGWYWK